VLLTAAGVLLSRDFYQRLHYLAPAATIGAVCTALAVVVTESLSGAAIKALATAAVLVVMNPILTHATARAARARQAGGVNRERPE
jgi:multicomponent Na+:H+ antiporter subunit G